METMATVLDLTQMKIICTSILTMSAILSGRVSEPAIRKSKYIFTWKNYKIRKKMEIVQFWYN